MERKLMQIQDRALEELAGAGSLEDLNEIRVRYLGKKGDLTGVLRGMGALSAEERPRIGQVANQVKERIEDRLNEITANLKDHLTRQRLAAETLDITLPGTAFNFGRLHPLTVITRQIEDIFLGLGFSIAEGPEVELDYYNFEALNLPKDHPARDMQDTFFITPEVLLRTHTSPVQVRTMERTAPAVPVKVIVPGKVYRRDDDATHSPMFHQVEGLAVDRRITMADPDIGGPGNYLQVVPAAHSHPADGQPVGVGVRLYAQYFAGVHLFDAFPRRFDPLYGQPGQGQPVGQFLGRHRYVYIFLKPFKRNLHI